MVKSESTLETAIDEPKARLAVELYYSRFGTNRSVTVHEAAERKGVTGTEVHLYITNHVEDGLGLPETRREAMEYLKKLRTISPSYSS